MKNWTLLFCLMVLALQSAPAAHAPDKAGLKFTYAVVNIPGAYLTEPVGINNAGVVIGTYWDFHQNIYAFILDSGKITKLKPPGALPSNTTPFGLNLNGPVSVVGCYFTNAYVLIGFLYKDGRYTNILGPSGSLDSIASGINDNGSIVGAYWTEGVTNGAWHGFLLENGVYTTLDVPGAVQTVAFGINDRGEIILRSQDSNGNYNLSLYNGETYKNINLPYAYDAVGGSVPQGINSSGDISYTWFDAINVAHGALRHEGKYYRFDYPTYTGTWAGGINDLGNIIGNSAGEADMPYFGFKATYSK